MDKKEIYNIADSLRDVCKTSCSTIWSMPELGGSESKSSDYFRKLFADHGFTIVNEDRLPYAFMAEYGSGYPVVAILGEYDALPGLSQKVSTHREAITEGAPGHGCGHNLLGTASAVAALTVSKFLAASGMPGTVRFYGCPEEELLSGKVKMAAYNMFDGCDLAISWHPMSGNLVYDSGYLACASAHFDFKGISSHAAFAPERGRSALDAVELMNVGVNYLREHVTSSARIHYTTDSGGFAPNIVPPRAGSWYYVRAPYISDVRQILERIRKIAEGACLMTETSMTMTIDYGCCELQENHSFADLAYDNLGQAGLPVFTEEELKFAAELEATIPAADASAARKLYGTDTAIATGIGARDLYAKSPLTASSDSGDVSHIMPMCALSTSCWPAAVSPHTWQSCACAGSSIGEKGAFYAAKVMAGIAYDLYTDKPVRDKIIAEFDEKKEPYTPMFGQNC